MTALTIGTPTAAADSSQARADAADPQLKPLPTWFFAFEGVLGGAYDLCHANRNLVWAVVAVGLVNMAVGLTVLRKRAKLVRRMLRNGRTRWIAIGLIALRFAVHAALSAIGTEVDSPAGHVAMAAILTATTVTLLWFDQRVTFRALGLLPQK